MSEDKSKQGFAFTIVEDDGQNVIIEVSEEDYQREKAAGLADDELLKPGRHKLRRGGFLERHPELKVKEKKRA
ncbi:MAG TPA: hypothetical protein VJS44_08080 [Pyrinomonadaceae bacterium]|nr:hypothetical protein [Pyrinomonadaceae bacterium]